MSFCSPKKETKTLVKNTMTVNRKTSKTIKNIMITQYKRLNHIYYATNIHFNGQGR